MILKRRRNIKILTLPPILKSALLKDAGGILFDSFSGMCHDNSWRAEKYLEKLRTLPLLKKGRQMYYENIDKKYKERLEKDSGSIDKEDVQKLIDKGTAKAERLKNSKDSLVVRLCKQFKLVYMMLRDWVRGTYQCPWKTIAGLTAAALYFINPFDIIPDLLPFIGLTDDASVMLLAISLNHFDLLEYCEKMGLDPQDYGLNAGDDDKNNKKQDG